MGKVYKKFTITRKRADWLKGRDTTLRGEPMKVNDAFADRLSNEAQMMVRKMHLDVSKNVNNLFKSSTAKKSIGNNPKKITLSNVAMDASISVQARILMNALMLKWQKRFNDYGMIFAKKMITNVDSQTSKNLKKSTDKLSGGLNIKTDSMSQRTKDIILSSSDESSSLIKTIATDYTTSVKEAVFRSISTNEGSFTTLKDSINEALVGRYRVYKNKAKNVALDQTRKVYNNLAASRMRDVGLDEYIWRHRGGAQKPNQFHVHDLNGNKYKLSDPPIIDKKTGTRGKPGDWYGCGCYMEPVITFE